MAVVAHIADFQCASDYCWCATAYVFASSYGGSYCAAEWHCLARSLKDQTNYLTSVQNGSRTESDINVCNCAIDSIRKYSSSCFVIEFTTAITNRHISGMIAVVANFSDYCSIVTTLTSCHSEGNSGEQTRTGQWMFVFTAYSTRTDIGSSKKYTRTKGISSQCPICGFFYIGIPKPYSGPGR